ncbi:MAG: response regulator transcription factor [Nitrospirae bacterium]|nr:response regulator transcription factor [Nitrospirota bacterium]
MEKVLVIEDDHHIAELLRMMLATQHFTPVVANDGGTGLSEARRLLPSLILLDLLLPTMDGLEVCRRLRADEKTRHIPIIMVTAKGEEEDRVAGLELGADDYVVKPFSPRELVARIRAVFRRKTGQASTAGLVRVGELEINAARHVVTVEGRYVHLTMMEFTILQRLAQYPGRVFTRDQLLTLLWGEDCFVQEHSLDVHIHTIRKKVEADPGHPLYIQTVHGVGYKLKEPSHQRGN